MAQDLKRTPLYDVHLALGARMVEFAGFEMPLQYSGIIEEHRAVRERAGIFDVSHMGEFMVRGRQAFDLVQRAITNDLRTLYPGRALYTVMCNEDGGTVDDLIVYMLGHDALMLVVNAANTASDYRHLRGLLEAWDLDCSIEDRTDLVAQIALQGPAALDILDRVSPFWVKELKNFHFAVPEPGFFLGCQDAIISRTGYTGEAGVEIYCEPARAAHVWETLMAAGQRAGLLPCGLGARDTLRLEAGYPLYGNELSETISPLEAGLDWVVKLDKGAFVGREALARQQEQGVARRLVGFIVEGRGIPRTGYEITGPDGAPVGQVTSGSQSPVLNRGIGLGLVANEPQYTEPGAQLGVRIRDRILPAEVVRPPFFRLRERAALSEPSHGA